MKLKGLKKLSGLSPRANYTDRTTAVYRRSCANFCGEGEKEREGGVSRSQRCGSPTAVFWAL
jgi:hypothetical protein